MNENKEIFKKFKGALIVLAIGVFFQIPIVAIIGYALCMGRLNSLASISEDFGKAKKYATWGLILSCFVSAVSALYTLVDPTTLIETAELFVEAELEYSLSVIPFYGYAIVALIIGFMTSSAIVFMLFAKYTYSGLKQYCKYYEPGAIEACDSLAEKMKKWSIVYVITCSLGYLINFVDIYVYNYVVAGVEGTDITTIASLFSESQSKYSIYGTLLSLIRFIFEVVCLVHTYRLAQFVKSLSEEPQTTNETTIDDAMSVESTEKNTDENKEEDDWRNDFK